MKVWDLLFLQEVCRGVGSAVFAEGECSQFWALCVCS